MKLARGNGERPRPVALPGRSDPVTLMPWKGDRIPARVLECGPDTLLVAITVPTKPLSDSQLEGMVLEFLTAQGRVRLGGTAAVQDSSASDVLRIDELRSLGVTQEREYVRIEAIRPVLVYLGADQMPVQSYTIDLSGGGFLLAGPDSLKVGDKIEFQLTLTPGLPVGGTGKIVRLDPQGRRAVAFDSISDVDRRRVVHFIFECQRAERRKGLEMDDRHGD